MRDAWRRDDPRIEADAVEFWNRIGILPPGIAPEERAKELVAAVYAGGRIVAVATAALQYVPELRARFAIIRASTDPDYRRRGAMWALAIPVHEILERWSRDHPEEKLAGRLGANKAHWWGELARMPVPPAPGVTLLWFNEEDEQIRGGWFDHFRFDSPSGDPPQHHEPPARPMSVAEAFELAQGYELRPAWRLDDPQIERDAVEFWRRLDILPSDVTPEERARELTAVAYKDGRVVGVHTGVISRLEQVRARLAFIRAAVDPEHRRSHVSMALGIYTRDILERWAAEHPEEKLAGLGAVIEGPNLFERAREPVWPHTRYILAGHLPDGRQLRISWFEGFRFD